MGNLIQFIFFSLWLLVKKISAVEFFYFSTKKCRSNSSTAQGHNYPERPMWIIIAFHLGTHVYVTLGIWGPSLGEIDQNVEGPH